MGVNAFSGFPRRGLWIAAGLSVGGILIWWGVTAGLFARDGLRVRVSEVSAVREGSAARVTVTGVFFQSADTPSRLEPPRARLLSAKGDSFPAYVGPFLDEPILPGRGPVTLSLHYHVPVTELGAPLTLDLDGSKTAVSIPPPKP